MKKLAVILIAIILSALVTAGVLLLLQPADNLKEIKRVTGKDGLSVKVLTYAINGYRWAIKSGTVKNTAVLTIVDFNRPSNERRLWVLDLKNDHVLMHIHVAQGKNTGKLYAKHFSNRPGSYESSPGVYTTASVFEGEHGESLHVKGLEKGINSNAASRAIEIHPAWYVTPAFIKEHGYAGRSWGCFAVNPKDADEFIGYIKGGSVLFAYGAPEEFDPRVDHPLTKNGEQMYTAITGVKEDPVLGFFQSF
jgi:hypothetical protein